MDGRSPYALLVLDAVLIAASIMYHFTCNITSLLCCLPFRRRHSHNDGNDNNNARTSTLITLQVPTSTLSLPLPYNTVPHSSSESHSDDARALHHIFSSSSSIRGYQTAATTPGYVPTTRPSLDLDFKFGESSTQPRPSSRVEQISQHVKQKLSESRLSRASSRKSKKESTQKEADLTGIVESSPGNGGPLSDLVINQSPAGLSGLLGSANASQGGYDSDAKSLNSPMLGSSAGTITISSGFVRQALERFEPLSPSSRTPVKGARDASATSPQHTMIQGSPFPSLPNKTSFADALRIEHDESPRTLLRRISAGIADGTIDVPATPELRAARLPSINEANTDWHLVAPKRSSSLPRKPQHLEEKHAVDSTTGDRRLMTSEDTKRASLISELDPVLLDYLDQPSQRCSVDAVAQSPVEQDVDNPQVRKEANVRDENERDRPHLHSTSTGENDRNSLHLFNMRISQRLASQSQIPGASSSTSRNASQLVVGKQRSHTTGSSSRATSYPTRVAREHNRQPSDPETKLLFEKKLDMGGQNSSWKTVSSVPSDFSYPLLSHGRLDDISVYSTANSTRRNSQSNPHSLAMGGRSFSGGTSSHAKALHLSPAESGWSRQRKSSEGPRQSEDSWLAPSHVYQRGRSLTIPLKRAGNDHTSPTPVPKRLREKTRVAEQMSEVSIGPVLERRNEMMSEVDHKLLIPPDGTLSRDSIDVRLENLDAPNYQNAGRHDDPASRRSSQVPSIGIQECATDVWTRAFKQAREQAGTDDGFLTAPKFDREGRRRSTRSSISNEVSQEGNGAHPVSSSNSRRSRSTDDAHRVGSGLECNEHGLDRATETPSLPTSLPGIQRDQVKPRQDVAAASTQRKKSLFDLMSRFQGAEASTKAETSPFKDLVTAWSRFPSHDRVERNGSAGDDDAVIAADYLVSAGGCTHKKEGQKTSNHGEHAGWAKLPHALHKSLDKGKSKSMALRRDAILSPAERARKSRKGVLGR